MYRGIRNKVDLSYYKEGETVVWPGFSSTSPDMNTTKAFLSRRNDAQENEEDDYSDGKSGSKKELCKGTLFIIEDAWGYDIEPFSIFKGEKEILLEPERKFEVVSVINGDEFTVVNLKMVDTAVILKKIFGKRK